MDNLTQNGGKRKEGVAAGPLRLPVPARAPSILLSFSVDNEESKIRANGLCRWGAGFELVRKEKAPEGA